MNGAQRSWYFLKDDTGLWRWRQAQAQPQFNITSSEGYGSLLDAQNDAAMSAGWDASQPTWVNQSGEGVVPGKNTLILVAQTLAAHPPINDNTAQIVSFPNLTTIEVGGYLSPNLQSLEEFLAPNLTTLNDFLDLYGMSKLTTVDLSALATCVGQGYVSVAACPLLTALDFPALQTATAISAGGNTVMTRVTLPVLKLINPYQSPTPNNYFDFSGAALDQASVDGILIAVNDAQLGFVPVAANNSVKVNGGTNAPPSAAGIAAKNALIAAGWAVTTN
jgi:hypothetical protein